MKIGIRLALAAYIGFFIYSLLVFFCGQSGIIARRLLNGHRGELVENIEALERIRSDLIANRNALLHENDEILLLARQLNYFRDGQTSIVINGMQTRNKSHTLGRVLLELPETRRNPTLYRAIGFSISLLAALIAVLYSAKRRGRTVRK